MNVGTGILVAAGSPEGIRALEDLCELTAAVQADAVRADDLAAITALLEANRLPKAET